jgi:hypothetical protein
MDVAEALAVMRTPAPLNGANKVSPSHGFTPFRYLLIAATTGANSSILPN